MAEQPLLQISDRAEMFLADLKTGDVNEYVRGPGIPGPYRKAQYSRGLKDRHMRVHPSGKGLCWTSAGAVEKFEVSIAYEDRRAANPEATKKLLEEFRRTNLGLGPRPAEPVASPAGTNWSL